MEAAAGTPRVAVIGGGVSGLVAARRLTQLGADVVLHEASNRLGGQIRTVQFAGVRVDVGAEALHGAAPGGLALVDELGLTDRLVTARPGTAWLWHERGLAPLPAGVGPAGPTRLGPVVRARVLTARGVLRAGLEPLTGRRPVGGDTSVGEFLTQHFGREVTERLVDPLLGSLHAGDVHRLSLRAATPQLAALASRQRSLLLAHRSRATANSGPGFVSFADGLGTVVDHLARGLDIRLGSAVTAIEAAGERHVLHTPSGRQSVDGVVLALPAHAAAQMLAPVSSGAAHTLGRLHAATVATVVVAYPRQAAEATAAMRANGILVPSQRRTLMKAATFLSAKWPHLDARDQFLVRLSAGRAGSSAVHEHTDDDLVEALHAELATATGLRTEPLDAVVARWPSSIAQLEVGHLERVAAVRAALPASVALAGAPYDGIGISSCITSGERAATSVLATLDPGRVPA